MQEPPSGGVEGLDEAVLTPVIRRLLEDGAAEVRDWTTEPLAVGSTSAAGVYRLVGTARRGGGRDGEADTVTWSVVLKQVAAGTDPAASDPTGAAYWRREPLVFVSGLLEGLAGGLTAPKCFGVDERPDGTWLWLEDVTEAAGAAWPVDRYGLAARHLGQFGGAWLTATPPVDAPWLTRGLIRGRVERRAGEVGRLVAARHEPGVGRFWPGDQVDRFTWLAARRAVLLDALDRLPQGLQHGDAGRKNLFARRRAGRDETVAIDWSMLGIGALGEDAATLAGSSVVWFQVDTADAAAVEEACLEGYLAGLHDAGWRGDPGEVRLGVTVALALRFAFLALLEFVVPPEQWSEVAPMWGRPFEEALERVAFVRRWTLAHADKAFTLLETR